MGRKAMGSERTARPPKGEVNMKKFLLSICIALCLVLQGSAAPLSTPPTTVEFAFMENHRVMIENNGERSFYYLSSAHNNVFPLLNEGVNKITLLENIGGTRFKVVSSEEKIVSSVGNNVFLESVQEVDFENSKLIDGVLQQIVGKNDSDLAKVEKIRQWMVDNMSYDYDFASTVRPGYIPILDNVISSKQGICYDFSVLYAGLLRSAGVPTKLVKGYTEYVDGYHAWNEVFINGKWEIVDITVDLYLQDSVFKTATKYSLSSLI